MSGEIIKINEAISYKIFPRTYNPTTSDFKEFRDLGFTTIHKVGSRDPKIVNGWIKHLKKIEVDFTKDLVVFLIDYSKLPSISPRIEDLETYLQEPD
jgi:hypothetical protein